MKGARSMIILYSRAPVELLLRTTLDLPRMRTTVPIETFGKTIEKPVARILGSLCIR